MGPADKRPVPVPDGSTVRTRGAAAGSRHRSWWVFGGLMAAFTLGMAGVVFSFGIDQALAVVHFPCHRL